MRFTASEGVAVGPASPTSSASPKAVDRVLCFVEVWYVQLQSREVGSHCRAAAKWQVRAQSGICRQPLHLIA